VKDWRVYLFFGAFIRRGGKMEEKVGSAGRTFFFFEKVQKG
jgi:hypothetical protein